MCIHAEVQMAIKSPHSLISRKPRICGGSPTIDGTRIRVSDIVRYSRLYPGDPERIQKAMPHLDLTQINAAISYYADNRPEIDREIAEEDALAGDG
jgi:uncharacterized protein (DUF433 family)